MSATRGKADFPVGPGLLRAPPTAIGPLGPGSNIAYTRVKSIEGGIASAATRIAVF